MSEIVYSANQLGLATMQCPEALLEKYQYFVEIDMLHDQMVNYV